MGLALLDAQALHGLVPGQLQGLGRTVEAQHIGAVGRLLQSLLFQTSPYDPLTLVAIVALLIVVGVVAAVSPARRATKLDPVVVLRND